MHGVLGFGRLLGVGYFNGVAEHLRQRFPGCAVLPTVVDFLGEVKHRAAQAAQQIANPPTDISFDSTKPIHIIAHSMGGLDARFLTSKNLQNLQNRIKTITCLGTPHFGSPVATILDIANPFQLFPFHGQQSNSTFIDELRVRQNALHDLSEKLAEDFNNECPDISSVHYFDVAGVGRNGIFHTSAPFAPTFLVVTAAAGRNDGVVPFTSATRRRQPAFIWPADHADLVGHDLNGPTAQSRPAFDYLAAYDNIVRTLILPNQ